MNYNPNSFSPEKQHMIEELKQSLSGKSPNEALPILMNWQKEIKQKNIQFTQEENKQLTETLYEQLSPQQKKQFELLRRMLK